MMNNIDTLKVKPQQIVVVILGWGLHFIGELFTPMFVGYGDLIIVAQDRRKRE